MARNEEKQYSRLNRLLLQRQREEYRKRNPKRPKLDNLNSVEEIKEWLPSIKRDLDFNLKQSEVTCYSEHKISEIQSNILQLEREFKSFVCKSKQLNPAMNHIPWTNRPYKSNKTNIKDDGEEGDLGTFIRIKTPILQEDSLKDKDSRLHFSQVEANELDQPLQFTVAQTRLETSMAQDDGESSGHSERCNWLGIDYSSSESES